MTWITGERPGVFVDYDGSQITGGSASGGSVALITVLKSNERIKTFSTVDALVADGEVAGSAEVLAQAKSLLTGNFTAVHIVPVDGSFAAYIAATQKMDQLVGLCAIVCDSTDPAVHQIVKNYLVKSADNQRELLGFVCAENTQAAKESAVALNCMRMVMTAQGGTVAACALAAAVNRAKMSDPLYGLELSGAPTIENRLSETAVDELIRSGVTPLEMLGGRVYSIRTVTTRSSTDGVFDRTLLDLQVVRIVDHVLANVRLTLRRMLGNARNTGQSSLAISTQTRLVLENMVAAGLIAEYDPPIISQDADDPSICNVLLSFSVARGYARIVISANVAV